MQFLSDTEIENVSGGMQWEGGRQSANVIDCRGNGLCRNSLSGDIAWSESFDKFTQRIATMFRWG